MFLIERKEIGIFATEKDLCFIFGERIIGPFPATASFLDSLLELKDNFDDKSTKEKK